MPESLRLSRAQFNEIVAHARACKPEEACGLLAGDSEGRVERVFLMENARHSATFYEMDSQEQFQVFDQMQSEGLELVGIFHSHPHSPAFPSPHDLGLAFYPEAAYVIVSLMDREADCHAFRIVEEHSEEISLIVENLEG